MIKNGKGKNTKETLDWLNLTYDTSENVIKQLMDDGHSFVFHFGDLKVEYSNYEDFLIHWDDDTGIPCWTCGRELFKLRNSDYLHCFGLGKWLGNV